MKSIRYAFASVLFVGGILLMIAACWVDDMQKDVDEDQMM